MTRPAPPRGVEALPSGPALAAAIEAAWDALAVLQDEGRVSDAQFTHAMHVVEGYPDDEIGEGFALRYLRMALKAPGSIGVNLTEPRRPDACGRCGKAKGEPGWGWVDHPDRSVPCEGCNPKVAQLHRHGHFDVGHLPCDECRPHRGKPGQSAREAETEQRSEQQTERTMEGLA